MEPLTPRIEKLREAVLNAPPFDGAYVGQRLLPALRALERNAGAPLPVLRSRMLAAVISESAAVIRPGELIAGYNYSRADEAVEFETNLRRRTPKSRQRLAAYLEQGCLTVQDKEYILDALDRSEGFYPPEPDLPEAAQAYQNASLGGVVWSPGVSENHTVLGYEKVLRLGFAGLVKKIDAEAAATPAADTEKHTFLACLREVAKSACGLGRRYAQKARELLASCTDEQQRRDLEIIIKVTARVPERPARTFREAVQALWFAHIINTWEDGINANSIGRVDQILYPYYRKDIAAGRITKAEAFELICCLWLKLYRDYDVQQAMVGGLDAAGKDAANDLSYMALDVTEALGFVRCLSVRLHRGSPDALVRRALEVVGRGKGIPFFFNDEVLIPALASNGIAPRDAHDYAAIGCVEITIPGKANPHAVSNRVNLLKCLELALNDGVSMTSGDRLGPATGRAEDFTCIADVVAAYETQTAYFIRLACGESNRLETRYGRLLPMAYKSLLTEGCLRSGRDFNAGGAKYNYHESMPMGIPNVADSLAALDQLVFQEKRYTLAETLNILRGNFADESVRREFLHAAPKFGNDDDRADNWAAYAMAHYCRELRGVKGVSGLGFFAQPFTFLWLIEAGSMTAATPDGRRDGENLAYSVSPMQGRDTGGMTAVLNSIAKLPARMAAGSTSAIIEADPALFEPGRLVHMVTLMKTAVQKGVGQLQFNVVSAETLKKAQERPDEYANLAVRVSGFSQRFCLLDKKLQDHIIARTKHEKM
ncbi:MAG TPA: pyruvate formate lyase family protein [Clostridiales bacterium]|nr:MAG: Benzylsuccinate synthase alpha subunit [Firmicutes bacterium ADurb.Bin262]HOU09211.1 pyruvate formate lyase family protein [Clostridiales bacterium]HQK74352.1 pyruvate formate lyase family protein [Clostridiales bacterium]